jgi:hypothetical protein
MMGSRGMGAIAPSKMPKSKTVTRKDNPNEVEVFAEGGKVKSPAWQRKEGKSEKGGLNAKGRASYNKANPGKPGLKAPQPEGGSRRDSFCARMSGMPGPMKDEKGKPTRKALSLKAWNC